MANYNLNFPEPIKKHDLFPALDDAINAVLTTGTGIMNFFKEGGIDSEKKDDGTDVTVADKFSSHSLYSSLGQNSGIGYCGEERYQPEETSWLDHEKYFLVDPLDSSRSFKRGKNRFSILVALMEKNVEGLFEPVLSCCYRPHPEGQQIVYALKGAGSYVHLGMKEKPDRMTLSSRTLDNPRIIVSGSRGKGNGGVQSLTNFFTEEEINCDLVGRAGTWKIVDLANGNGEDNDINIYLNLKPAQLKIWDTGAPQLILTESMPMNGQSSALLTHVDGNPIDYTSGNVEVTDIVGSNGISHEEILEIIRNTRTKRSSTLR